MQFKSIASLSTIVVFGFISLVSNVALARDVVSDWNSEALETVRIKKLGAPDAARLYAMVNAAMYDAVNGITRARNYFDGRKTALVGSPYAPSRADKYIAAASAAHGVLHELHPDRSAIYDHQLVENLAERRGFPYVEVGRQWGTWVGHQVVDRRANDGSSPAEEIPGSTDPGRFREDFKSAQYANMDPFAIDSADPYTSDGPPALTSLAYAAALMEVQLLGNDAIPQPEFEEIFSFWKGGSGSARPPGEWIKIALVVADEERTTRNIDAMSRLMALMGMAMADAVIPAWINKARYLFWRPQTAIQNANTDGNTLTVADPHWVPRNGSKGGSPEHTSGQSTFAGAGSTILAGFYCNDFVSFSFTGDNSIAGPRSFSSFSEAAEEAGRARMFAGIHFNFSDRSAQDAGRRLGNEIVRNRLQRNGYGHHPAGSRQCPQS